jgi:hypothetical protein
MPVSLNWLQVSRPPPPILSVPPPIVIRPPPPMMPPQVKFIIKTFLTTFKGFLTRVFDVYDKHLIN